MAENRFYRTDYPSHLTDELGNRFNPNNQFAPNPGFVELAATIIGYNESTKEYDLTYATFEDWQMTQYNSKGTTTVTTTGPLPAFSPTTGALISTTSTSVTSAAVTNTLTKYNSKEATVEHENITITGVKIDIGGRVGQLSRAEITITTAGISNMDIVNNAITQIGSRIELDISREWAATYNSTANKMNYTGRIHDFSYSLDSDMKFTITLKAIGLAESLSQLNAVPVLNPNGKSWPAGFPKEYIVKDGDTKTVPVNNLLILLDALWEKLFPGSATGNNTSVIGIQEIPGVSGIGDSKPYAYVGARPANITGGLGSNLGWQVFVNELTKSYINLEALRVLVMKTIEMASAESDNKLATKLNITYPVDASGNYNTAGSYVDYLDSANPENILLFNNSISGIALILSPIGLPVPIFATQKSYYSQPIEECRYKTKTAVNIQNIYISRDVIFQAAGAELGDTRYDVAGNKSIEKFFQSIFEVIKNDTGGIIDLMLLPELNESLTSNEQTTLYIVDSNYVKLETPKAPSILQFPLFPEGQHHFKDFASGTRKLSAKVPKSLAAKAFVKDANLVANDSSTSGPGEIDDTTDINPSDLIDELNSLRRQWTVTDNYRENTTRRREIMSSLWKSNIADKKVVKSGDALKTASATRNIQTGLDFGMTSYGINGFLWGHAIALDFIPNTAPANTVFSVNKISHDIQNGAEDTNGGTWFTTIDCLARIRPANEASNIKSVATLKTASGAGGSGPDMSGNDNANEALQDTNPLVGPKPPSSINHTGGTNNSILF